MVLHCFFRFENNSADNLLHPVGLRKRNFALQKKWLLKDIADRIKTVEKDNFYDPYKYSSKVYQFVDTLKKHNFMIVFDHSRWQSEANKYIEDPKLLESADLLTLRKLLTLHIRKECFCSGHLTDAIDTRHMVKYF